MLEGLSGVITKTLRLLPPTRSLYIFLISFNVLLFFSIFSTRGRTDRGEYIILIFSYGLNTTTTTRGVLTRNARLLPTTRTCIYQIKF